MQNQLVKIRRGNVILRVPAEQVDRYLKQGYSSYDENGNLNKRVVTNDVATLQAEQARADKIIADLKKKVSELKAHVKELERNSSDDDYDLRKENEDLCEQVSTLKSEIKDLKKKLKDAEKRLQRYEE